MDPTYMFLNCAFNSVAKKIEEEEEETRSKVSAVEEKVQQCTNKMTASETKLNTIETIVNQIAGKVNYQTDYIDNMLESIVDHINDRLTVIALQGAAPGTQVGREADAGILENHLTTIVNAIRAHIADPGTNPLHATANRLTNDPRAVEGITTYYPSHNRW